MKVDHYSRPMKMILTLLISMSLITSCQRNEHVFAKEDLSQQKTILDLSYGKDTAQRMDVYLPANRSVDSTKSIILIHGGGWNSGGKNDFATYIDLILIHSKNECLIMPFSILITGW
jgi:acetyl esterase/lipase